MKYGYFPRCASQATVLLTAAVISIVLWFIPYAEILTYPFRIFVPFVHEAARPPRCPLPVLVASLSIATNASGEPTRRKAVRFRKCLSPCGLPGLDDLRALLLV